AHVLRRAYQIRVERRNGLQLLWQGFYATVPFWSLLLVYWTTSITRGINIGIRHILPTFPATFILAGIAGAWWSDLFGRGNLAPNKSVPSNSGPTTAAAA